MRSGVGLLLLLLAVVGCKGPLQQNLPPSERLLEPGPGVGGPGPGVMMFQPVCPTPPQTSQVAFVGPEGMTVTWDVGFPGAFDSQPLVVPGRYNFPQGAIYRLKLTAIPSRPGVELYPTVEVAPTLARTAAFLNHNAIPVQFTEEDFDQVLSGNFVTKVIYLPDPEFQELALAGVETLVSTRLDPGIDPIVEANRRGAILAIVRIGNKDLQTPSPGSAMNGAPGVVPASFNQDGSPVMGMTRPPALPYGRADLRRSRLQLGCAADELYCRRHRPAVRHALLRHAHRPGRSAARPAGHSRRPAAARDGQPYVRESS